MELEKLGLPGEGKFQSPIRRGSRCNEMQNVNINAVLSVSVPYLSGQALQFAADHHGERCVGVSVPYLSGQALQWHKTGVNSTFCPNFVSTFCQGARQPTA